MQDSQNQIEEFMQLVLRNLEKNGFPAQAVSFPLDKMYESASRRGFSFNKIRTLFEEKNIETELTTDHVIFRQQASTEDLPDDPTQMAELARQMLQNMEPEKLAQIQKLMTQLKPEDLSAIQEQWESMSAAEKAQLLGSMPK